MKNIYTTCKYSFVKGLLVITAVIFSCKKAVEVGAPIDQIVAKEVYNNAYTASGVLTGIYYNMSRGSFVTGPNSVSALTGLSGDELTLIRHSGDYLNRVFRNNLSSTINTPSFWTELYTYIFTANSALEGLSAGSLSLSVKNQLVGEAKFIRAFCYFYLMNLYGDVPLVTTTDYKINSVLPRTSKSLVYKQIINDLEEAQKLLNKDYVLAVDVTISTTERIRPNKACATALLARVYLYSGEYLKAEAQSTLLIENTNYELLMNLDEVFLKNSKESIWQLQPVVDNLNTLDGNFFIIIPEIEPSIKLSDVIFNKFQDDDFRKLHWIGNTKVGSISYRFPYKYKESQRQDPGLEPSEYLTIFRLAEQYLIRAEARTQLNKIDLAQNDLNAVRLRAGLPDSQANNKSGLLAAILQERQLEFFTELGHRWFDLQRSGEMNVVMTSIAVDKGTIWNDNWALYPIPQDDINKNPGLSGHQNLGY